MEIKDLIKVFKQLLPIYKDAYLKKLLPMNLSGGLCFASYYYADYILDDVMNKYTGYYSNLIVSKNESGMIVFLFPKPESSKDLKSRIDFMESEIKDLKRLLKQGYTHV